MRESIVLGCELVCVLFVLVVLVATLMYVVSYFLERIADGRKRLADDPRPEWMLANDIRSLDRWCCWHFPITEDICAWLLNPAKSIGDFRAELISKYGERKPGPVTSTAGEEQHGADQG